MAMTVKDEDTMLATRPCIVSSSPIPNKAYDHHSNVNYVPHLLNKFTEQTKA